MSAVGFQYVLDTSIGDAEKLECEARSALSALQSMALEWYLKIEAGTMQELPLPQLQAAIGRLKDVKTRLKRTLRLSEVTVMTTLTDDLHFCLGDVRQQIHVFRDMAIAHGHETGPAPAEAPGISGHDDHSADVLPDCAVSDPAGCTARAPRCVRPLVMLHAEALPFLRGFVCVLGHLLQLPTFTSRSPGAFMWFANAEERIQQRTTSGRAVRRPHLYSAEE